MDQIELTSVVIKPSAIPKRPYEPHSGENRQYMRDIILGFNDGLVSTFLLVIGLSAGGATAHSILLAAIAGAVAGSIAMGLGEFLATKSQVQVQESDIALEQEHFKYHREMEIDQVREFMGGFGLEGNLLEDVTQTIAASDETLLNFMIMFEFGQTEDDKRNPLVAMAFSGVLFTTGALPSIIPFACTSNVETATIVAAVLCMLSCFALGAAKTTVTKGKWLKSGMENMLMAAVGAGISYGVGAIFQAIVPGTGAHSA